MYILSFDRCEFCDSNSLTNLSFGNSKIDSSFIVWSCSFGVDVVRGCPKLGIGVTTFVVISDDFC